MYHSCILYMMTVYSSDDSCEWDSEKDILNRSKHGLSFETASKVFCDPWFVEIPDDIHSTLEEEHFQGFGTINGIAIVTIFYSERCSDGKLRHRLISARRLDSLEKKAYENYLQAYR